MVGEPLNLNEFQELARQALPKMYYDFYAGGAEDQYTLEENMEAFRRIMIRPRILVDVSRIDLSTNVLGYNISAPILIAPTALHKLAHPEGEVVTARAAAACKTIMALSFTSSCTLEEVASSCNAVRFFQIYVYKRRDLSALLVQRAERNGYKALVLTADSPRVGRKEADIKNKMTLPKLKNTERFLSLEASSDIEWLSTITNMPILIKGLLTREDAIKAVKVGVAGIVVSNHGGRQLDYAPATITVLEEIGRPVIYGLAAKGEYGVRQVIQMLKDELELTMALSGCPSVKDITRRHVRTQRETLHSML
ncbi:hypothetical protein SO802_023591 [Lithocarpus litseifolius]|uniref:(S)-2-hydroxy-acid oxidase n=1 Tax=Lithocarpus litseifolius TaxID=425828 RepID=A0AAW2C8S7_9ROSI